MTGMILSIAPAKAGISFVVRIKNFICTYWVMGIFTLSLFIGMGFGAVFSAKADNSFMESVDFLFSTSFTSRLNNSVYQTYLSSLAANFIFLATAFLMGLSIWGYALLPAVSLFKGFGIGLTAGYLCSTYMLKGIAFYLLMLLPAAFLSVIALMLLQKEAFGFSLRLMRTVLRPDSLHTGLVKSEFLYFMKKGGQYLILSACASLLDIGAVLLFARFFEF